MGAAQTQCDESCRRIILTIILLFASTGMTESAAQQQDRLPAVVAASVPFYPQTPQMANIEGVVRLRVHTDGTQVSSIQIESGQPMLAQAAKENVKTWQFEKHSPTTFETIFRYRLLPSKCDSECNCDSLEKPTVLLRLPAEVEVNAKELLICDPAAKSEVEP